MDLHLDPSSKEKRMEYYKRYPHWKVIPLKVLGDKNTAWEYLLYERGWNDLPDNEKFGEVVNSWVDGAMSVYWPAFDCILSSLLFRDEVGLEYINYNENGRYPDKLTKELVETRKEFLRSIDRA